MTVPFKPICFVVMPYGVRDTGLPDPAPPRVDFDALWERALKPAIESAGYRAVRADQDYGALIIKEMLERLYYSDLVVADISLANANAYYEVGVRHAARHSGCVLIAADWSRPVFDLAQVRHLRYPNPDTVVGDAAAAIIRETLATHLPDHVDARSPFVECVPAILRGGDAESDGERARQLAGHLEDFERLRAEISAVRLLDTAAQRTAAAGLILSRHPAESTTNAPVACEMVRLFRDVIGAWERTIAYIDALPDALRQLPYLQEQYALAQSKQGDHVAAIAALEQLIAVRGNSAERQGLIGGRYKRLYDASVDAVRNDVDGARPNRLYLNKAIRHYESGMLLDLNGYYASGNLPALYRERGDDGDETLALNAATAARLACERARALGLDDEWTPHTLLGIAFAERRIDDARVHARVVEQQDAEPWKIETTLKALRKHVEQMPEPRDAFVRILERLATVSV